VKKIKKFKLSLNLFKKIILSIYNIYCDWKHFTVLLLIDIDRITFINIKINNVGTQFLLICLIAFNEDLFNLYFSDSYVSFSTLIDPFSNKFDKLFILFHIKKFTVRILIFSCCCDDSFLPNKWERNVLVENSKPVIYFW
jgi:hypothetical protein